MGSAFSDRRRGLTGDKGMKAPVDLATTGGISLFGEQVIDGVQTAQSRVLVWNQANPVENGVYDSSSGAWTRALDSNGNQDIAKGTQYIAAGGSQNALVTFVQTTAAPFPGASALAFSPSPNAVFLATLAQNTGGNLVGLYDPDDLFAGSTINAAILELAGPRRVIDLSKHPYLCDMTGATDNTWQVHLADVAAAASGAALYVPPGVLQASIQSRRSKYTLYGAGHFATTIKTPATTFAITAVSRSAGAVLTVDCADTSKLWVDCGIKISGVADASFNSGYTILTIASSTRFTCRQEATSATAASSTGGVISYASGIEIGPCAMGNAAAAYSGCAVKWLTIDGNKANRAAPSSDLTDWGLPITATSQLDIDVRAFNCHNGGVGAFINSNFGKIFAYAEACGNVAYTPLGFDLNSSKYLHMQIVTKDCYDGSRILGNCWGNSGTFLNYNPTRHGWVYNNNHPNVCYANDFSVVVVGSAGATGSGAILGQNVSGSNLSITVRDHLGVGVNIAEASTGVRMTGCNLVIATSNCGQQGLVSYADDCHMEHTSVDDARTGAAGTNFSADIYGSRGTLKSSIKNTGTAQSRGLAIRAGSSDVEVVSLSESNVVSTFLDSGTRTVRPKYRGAVQSIASAATITLPTLGDSINVTGTTSITSITADQANRMVTLNFAASLTVVDGANLRLAGNFNATADDTLTLLSIGTDWAEVCRSAN